jgi:hypothetical protein
MTAHRIRETWDGGTIDVTTPGRDGVLIVATERAMATATLHLTGDEAGDLIAALQAALTAANASGVPAGCTPGQAAAKAVAKYQELCEVHHDLSRHDLAMAVIRGWAATACGDDVLVHVVRAVVAAQIDEDQAPDATASPTTSGGPR